MVKLWTVSVGLVIAIVVESRSIKGDFRKTLVVESWIVSAGLVIARAAESMSIGDDFIKPLAVGL